MKLSLYVLLITLVLPLTGRSQEIHVHHSFGGMRFEMDTLTLTHRQVADLLSINPVAAKEFHLARQHGIVSSVLGFSGVLLVAVPMFSAILGGEPDWALAAGGGALVVASIPFGRVYKRKATHAVETYNSGLSGARLYFRGTAVGITF